MSQPTVWWQWLQFALELLASIGTIIASSIAIWLFINKGADIANFLRVIKNFIHQNSVSEMKVKLEQISTLHASDANNTIEISSLFLDICGQIDGSPYLKDKLSGLSKRIRSANTSKRPIQEPYKRALVSELRENLRHLDVVSFSETIGDDSK